jgi:TolA-binding protein
VNIKRVIFLIPLLALTACASQQTMDEDPTIQLLSEKIARIEPVALPPLSRSDVQRTYEQLAKNTQNDALKAIALQRLADLELENKQASDTEEKVISGPEKSQQAATADIEESEAEYAGSAIQQYERLLELYPDYTGNDHVMYQLARAYELKGDLEKTLDVLTQLITKYPEYARRDEVQFRRGEILFAFRDFEQAETAYDGVLAQGEIGAFYERAMFKRGWSVFKQGHTERSLESYFAVLDRSFAGGRRLFDFSRTELELLEDALRIVSLSFSYLKGYESIAEFFARHGQRDYEFRIYERLGDLYLTQQRSIDASDTFLAFVKRYPQHRQSPLFMVRVIDIYKHAGRTKELLRAKADLIVAYGTKAAFWEKQDEQLLTRLRPHLLSNLDDLTRYYHAEAQKTNKPADYRLAAHWYRTYVYSFPYDLKTPEKNMLLAESLLDSGDVIGAATEFENTAYAYPLHEQSAEAAYAALLAYRKQAESAKAGGRNQHETKQRIAIASGKLFVTTFPNDKRVTRVMSKAAEELLALKDYPQAVAAAHYVVGHDPTADNELLLINWAIIAQGEFELGLYPEAEAASLQRLRIAPDNDKNRNAHIERLAAAIYKQGEQARTENKLRDAARHFLRVGQLAPNSTIRANADYDAAASLTANNNWTLAIPVLKAFIQDNPNHILRRSADEKLALSYEKTGNWQQTAGAYEVLYFNETDNNKKRLLLWQTAEFYEKAKQTKQAIGIYKRYVATFPQPFDEAIEARYRLATIYKATNKIPSRHYWLRKIIQADKAGSGTDRSHFLSATASLELAAPSFSAYRKIHLVQPLKQNLKKKKKLMQESIKAYTEAANYGIEAVSTASTFRIAEIYTDFGRGLFESERPKGLSAEELEQYDILLEEQAYPFEEKAIEVHVVNTERTTSGVYDEWVKKSFKALTVLSPIRYAKAEKSEQVNHAIE